MSSKLRYLPVGIILILLSMQQVQALFFFPRGASIGVSKVDLNQRKIQQKIDKNLITK